MIFGNKDIYAIEVYHEPLDETAFYMTGRMCLYLNGILFGDISDGYCTLYGAYTSLHGKVKYIEKLKHSFNFESDFEVFNFLDIKLYLGDEESEKMTCEEVVKDMEPYTKFNFLNNDGEMFDGTKSFIYVDDKERVHVLYKFYTTPDEVFSTEIDKEDFLYITNEFIQWYENILAFQQHGN